MEERRQYRRAISIEGDYVWIPPSVMAVEFNKTPWTIQEWCRTGFIIELGFLIRRAPKGQWMVGVPEAEFARFKREAIAMTG